MQNYHILTKQLDIPKTESVPYSSLNPQHSANFQVRSRHLTKYVFNEPTTNGYRIKMLSWEPRVKSSHNVNHMEDEKQDERELQASGQSHEDPGSEEQLSLPPGSRRGGVGWGAHMLDISCSLLVQQVFRGPPALARK